MSAADPTHARRAPTAADPTRLRAARLALAEAHRATQTTVQLHTPAAVSTTTAASPGGAPAGVFAPPVRCVPTGWPVIDRALGGGLARGTVVELTGALSSGRLSAAVAVLTSALRTGRDPVAFVDACDALDPRSFDEGDRARVLWVRAGDATVAVRALDVLLDGGGFSVAVLYLAGAYTKKRVEKSGRFGASDRAGASALAEGAAPEELAGAGEKEKVRGAKGGRAQSPGALWTRVAQRAARAGTVVLVVTDTTETADTAAAGSPAGANRAHAVVPGPGPFAHARIATLPKPARWYDGAQATFLDGRALGLRVERARSNVALARPGAFVSEPATRDDDAWLRAV